MERFRRKYICIREDSTARAKLSARVELRVEIQFPSRVADQTLRDQAEPSIEWRVPFMLDKATPFRFTVAFIRWRDTYRPICWWNVLSMLTIPYAIEPGVPGLGRVLNVAHNGLPKG